MCCTRLELAAPSTSDIAVIEFEFNSKFNCVTSFETTLALSECTYN